MHEHLNSKYLDDEQKENYYNSYLNFIKNDKLRDIIIPNLGKAVSLLQFSNDEKKNDICQVIEHAFDNM